MLTKVEEDACPQEICLPRGERVRKIIAVLE